MTSTGTPPPMPPMPPPPFGQAPAAPQPIATAAARPATPPPNYMVWAVLTTLFCFFPLGIASIVFASQVTSKFNAGDLEGAERASTKAKQFAIYAAIAGAVLLVIAVSAAGSGSS